MEPTQWPEIVKNLGLPMAVVIFILWFAYYKGFPLLTKQLEDLRTDRRLEREEARAEREIQAKRNEEQGKLFAEALRLEREDNARRCEEQGRLFMEALRGINVFAAEIAEKSGMLNRPGQAGGRRESGK